MGVRRLEILDCAVLSVGASGIQFQESANVSDVLINNTLVNDTARVTLGQPGGIRVMGERNVTVSHNTIGHVPYAGIMVGWQTVTKHTQRSTIFDISYNHVHDYGLGILSDFGGIYLSSKNNLCFQEAPDTCHLPTHVYHNFIHRGSRYNYGAHGIYMDEQVSGVLMEQNLIVDVADQGVYFHCGSDNAARSNIVAFAGSAGVFSLRPRPGFAVPLVSSGLLPSMCNKGGNPTWPDMGGAMGFNYTSNVILLGAGPREHGRVASSQRDLRQTRWGWNTYWALNATVVGYIKHQRVWPNATTLAEWASSEYIERGAAAPSIVDPMFVDPEGGDFTLQEESPVLTQPGFSPWDTSTANIGCVDNPFGSCTTRFYKL